MDITIRFMYMYEILPILTFEWAKIMIIRGIINYFAILNF